MYIAAKAWSKAKKALHSVCYCKILKKHSRILKLNPIIDSISGCFEDARRAIAHVMKVDREKMTTTLTKAELADLLFEKVGLNKREAKDMVEAFFEEIRLQLEQG